MWYVNYISIKPLLFKKKVAILDSGKVKLYWQERGQQLLEVMGVDSTTEGFFRGGGAECGFVLHLYYGGTLSESIHMIHKQQLYNKFLKVNKK